MEEGLRLDLERDLVRLVDFPRRGEFSSSPENPTEGGSEEGPAIVSSSSSSLSDSSSSRSSPAFGRLI